MIDPKTLTRADVGRLVRYTSGHGETETGTISGWNEEYVFVRYGGSLTGKATSPAQLEFIEGFRLAFRVFTDGKLIFEDLAVIPANDIDDVMPRLAKQHWEALAGATAHMIEVEILDEPDPNERFMRFGTDPNGRVMPIAYKLKPPTIH